MVWRRLAPRRIIGDHRYEFLTGNVWNRMAELRSRAGYRSGLGRPQTGRDKKRCDQRGGGNISANRGILLGLLSPEG